MNNKKKYRNNTNNSKYIKMFLIAVSFPARCMLCMEYVLFSFEIKRKHWLQAKRKAILIGNYVETSHR